MTQRYPKRQQAKPQKPKASPVPKQGGDAVVVNGYSEKWLKQGFCWVYPAEILAHPKRLRTGQVVKLASESGESERISPFSYTTWARRFEDAEGRYGFAALALTLYQLRHGGASQDATSRSRTTAEIKKRIRWLDDRSYIRYENGGRVTKLLQRLCRCVAQSFLGSSVCQPAQGFLQARCGR